MLRFALRAGSGFQPLPAAASSCQSANDSSTRLSAHARTRVPARLRPARRPRVHTYLTLTLLKSGTAEAAK